MQPQVTGLVAWTATQLGSLAGSVVVADPAGGGYATQSQTAAVGSVLARTQKGSVVSAACAQRRRKRRSAATARAHAHSRGNCCKSEPSKTRSANIGGSSRAGWSSSHVPPPERTPLLAGCTSVTCHCVNSSKACRQCRQPHRRVAAAGRALAQYVALPAGAVHTLKIGLALRQGRERGGGGGCSPR